MSNVIKIKNGPDVPGVSDLQSYELGYVRGGALYINNNGTIVQLTDPKTSDLINSSNYLKIPKVAQTTSNTGRILVSDSNGVVYYKAPADIRSEIGAFASTGGTVSGATTFSSTLTVNNTLTAKTLVVASGNWGTSSPTGAGTQGQLYFKLIQE